MLCPPPLRLFIFAKSSLLKIISNTEHKDVGCRVTAVVMLLWIPVQLQMKTEFDSSCCQFFLILSLLYRQVYLHDIPQGSILAPLQFTLHINNIYIPTEHCHLSFYTDDAFLYVIVSTTNNLLSKSFPVSFWLLPHFFLIVVHSIKTSLHLTGAQFFPLHQVLEVGTFLL